MKHSLVTDYWIKKVLKDHYNTEWKEINMGLVRVMSSKLGVQFHEIEEEAFHGVDILAETVMEDWGLSFFIDKYLKVALH